MRLAITPLEALPVAEAPVEVVERKGLGHPDSICDSLAEEFSLALSRFYLERFGQVLHHNVDKVLLFGGASRPAFGGGEVREPIEIFLAGRATRSLRGVEVPVEELADEAVRRWLRGHLHALDPEAHVKLHCLVRPVSAELAELFLRQAELGTRRANDTSCGVGYAPRSPLEIVVDGVERHLNSRDVKHRHPEAGEDVKVMGVRHGSAMRLTVACAFVDRHVADASDYAAKKRELTELAAAAARGLGAQELELELNTADDPAAGSLYLTVTGTSAEAGDDGEAGRGNRANGLITPYRPMTMESVAGKNPMTHVGKLYNLAAERMAEALVAELPELREAQCYLVSQIGRPIGDPQLVDVRLRCAERRGLEHLEPRAIEVVRTHLAGVSELWRELVSGELALDRAGARGAGR